MTDITTNIEDSSDEVLFSMQNNECNDLNSTNDTNIESDIVKNNKERKTDQIEETFNGNSERENSENNKTDKELDETIETIDTDCQIQQTTGSSFTLHQSNCIELMEKVFDGEIWQLPLFAQSLFTFMTESIEDRENEDPRMAVHSVATRGMFVLQKAFELQEKKIEKVDVSEVKKMNYTREISAFFLGILYSQERYILCMVIMPYILWPIYTTLKSLEKNVVFALYIGITVSFLERN